MDLFLFKNALKDLLRVRRLPLYLLLVALPAAVALTLRLAARRQFDPSVAYNALSASLIFGFLLVILAVVFGTGVVSRELEQKTIVYLLTRPVARWRILLMRYLAAVTAITLTVWLATGLLALATWQRGGAGSAELTRASVKDFAGLAGRLRDASGPVADYLSQQLGERTVRMLHAYDPQGQPTDVLKDVLAEELNARIKDPYLYAPDRNPDLKVSEQTRQAARKATWRDREAVNLRVLNDLLPGVLAPSATVPLTGDDIVEPAKLADGLRRGEGSYQFLRWRIGRQNRQVVDAWTLEGKPSEQLEQRLVRDLNRVLREDAALYDADRFIQVRLDNQTRLAARARPKGPDLARLNRWLLEEAFPDEIASSRTASTQVGRDLLVLPLGALCYGALFMMLATLVSRALIGGLIFAFGWETWVPLMPGNFKLVSLMTYLRVLAPHPQPPAASIDVTEMLQMLTPSTIDAGPSALVLVSVLAVCVALSVLFFSRREYVPRDDA